MSRKQKSEKQNGNPVEKTKEKQGILINGKPTELTEAEFDRLNARLETNHKIRNDILTFTFSIVITALGVGLAFKSDDPVIAYLFLLPFFIIVPFQARLTYYRMEDAHIRAYFAIYRPEWDTFYVNARNEIVQVGESIGLGKLSYRAIAWLMNHEMVVLSWALAGIFYFRYCPTIQEWDAGVWVSLAAPVVLIFLVWWFASAAGKFRKVFRNYADGWQLLKEKELETAKRNQSHPPQDT